MSTYKQRANSFSCFLQTIAVVKSLQVPRELTDVIARMLIPIYSWRVTNSRGITTTSCDETVIYLDNPSLHFNVCYKRNTACKAIDSFRFEFIKQKGSIAFWVGSTSLNSINFLAEGVEYLVSYGANGDFKDIVVRVDHDVIQFERRNKVVWRQAPGHAFKRPWYFGVTCESRSSCTLMF